MEKYVVSIYKGQQNTAGSKAKEDIVTILNQIGYKNLSYSLANSKISRLLSGYRNINNLFKGINSYDLIVFQYPFFSRNIADYFIRKANKKSVYSVLLIHDVDSLRHFKNSKKDKSRELDFFNKFSVIIAHNEVMIQWLKDEGVTTKMISLEIFDYLDSNKIKINKLKSTISFAGNLEKSKFLEKAKINTIINAYGVNPSAEYPSNVIYKGSFPPDELGKNMQGSFGLVWDGPEIATCSGVTGEYMKYNNPHKVSLYISLGMPVIIWKEAALSKFIEENKLGYSISSITEIDSLIKNITLSEYEEIRHNVDKMSKQIKNGFYTKKALNEIEENFNNR